MKPPTHSEELRHDCAVAAALLLMELFGQGGPPAELFGQATVIVTEAILEAERRMADMRPETLPSLN